MDRLAERGGGSRQRPGHRALTQPGSSGARGGLPHPPGRGRFTSRRAARSDSAAAMSGGTGTFEPWKP